MRRRGLLGGTVAVLAACRSGAGETIEPEHLPSPPRPKPPPPEAAAELVVVGAGVRLRLRTPVEVERMSDDPLAPVRIVAGAESRQPAMLFAAGDEPAPDEPTVRAVGDGAWIELDPAVELSTLGTAERGPEDLERWSLALGHVAFAWPAGLVAHAFAGGLPRVELRRFADPRDVMIVVRGPLPVAELPSLDVLVGPGQVELARDPEASPPWIELSYTMSGDAWRQRHHRLVASNGAVVLVTAQATAELAARVLADGTLVARSVALTAR